MKAKAVGAGVYVDDEGGYWARPWINRRRTWRKLKAVQERAAIKEANQKEWQPKQNSFTELADAYLNANCPNRRLEERDENFKTVEESRIKYLKGFFGRYRPDEIKIPLLLAYKPWRIRQIKKGTGERTVDLDTNTLSNILSYGVSSGSVEFNFIRSGRPRFRKKSDISRSRERAPADGDELGKITSALFTNSKSETLGWQALFTAMTGCRTSELLRLRIDAKEGQPGYISGNHLFLGRRSKHGVNPFVLIEGEFKEMLERFLNWHKERFPKNPWFFPGRAKGSAISKGALGYAMSRVCRSLGLPRRSPHGFRSFYVTKRRSDGASDEQVAAEIGDATVSLISETYGDIPENWRGGKRLSWLPTKGKAPWDWTKSGLKAKNKKSVNPHQKANSSGAPTRS